MKIVIFGASGKTGTLMVNQALELGHQVTSYVRRANALEIEHPNLNVVVGNLNDTEKLKEAISGADACLSTLGGSSLTKHAPEIMSGIDKIVSIMERGGVNRFIYLSSVGVGESRYCMAQPVRFIVCDLLLRVPFADHHANEQRLMKSKLQFTLVRPGGLTDGPKTGNLKHGSEKTILKGNPKISRANVAAFMLEQLTDSTYVNKGVWLYE
ncbi:MAG TPA: SDR family oxidoreductase [Prolixibacteraceae bacterium]|nr:SDR family oxidoreductase [Prolixibacteraceae bacterium]HPS13345.1 SDR family oxidoreductase [Prolixibacteraceae bacterium]